MQSSVVDPKGRDNSFSQNWEQIDARRRKFVYQWGALQSYHANILIMHGLGEHGGRYPRLAQDFAAQGFRVVCFDQQGHGKSPKNADA